MYTSNKPYKITETMQGPPQWIAAWSEDISETDVIVGVVAAGISIYSASPSPFINWVKQLVQRTIDSLKQSAAKDFPQNILDEVVQLATQAIKAAVKGENANEVFKQFGTVDFKAGAIKYSGRNYVWNIFAERYDPIGPPTWGIKPYIAFRWRGAGSSGSGQSSSKSNFDPMLLIPVLMAID